MSTNQTIKEQLRRNAVALISLAVAVTSLGYNTWRNEASEHNRNQRLVAIQILNLLGEMEYLLLESRYGETSAPSLRKGWAVALTLKDMALVVEGDVPLSAGLLFETWSSNDELLESSVTAKDRVREAVRAVREDVHEVLLSLD